MAGAQTSTLNPDGATYSGSTSGWGASGPPAGSNRYGQYTRSRFELVFVVTGSADYTLTGSLRRFLNATAVLRLAALTPGGSPTITANATGTLSNNFASDPINWSGTLLAGTYKLSIDESAEPATNGEPTQGTGSTFTFVIPSPSTAFVLVGALPLIRRRRTTA